MSRNVPWNAPEAVPFAARRSAQGAAAGQSRLRQIPRNPLPPRHSALWTAENLPFRIEFFHPGYLYQEPVHINEFTLMHTQPIRFVQDFFDYGKLDIADKIPAKTGYAGFRVLYPLNQPGQMDELGAFLGASYFRLLGKDQHYGESARGLALDCGEGDRPEEFPIFTDWWLGKPGWGDKELQLYALLDSVSCTGAYEFFIHPGETTTVSIRGGALFPRNKAGRRRGQKPEAHQNHRPGAADEHVLVRQEHGTQI